jgi:disulfide bond formation protein DsbB
MTSRHWLWGMVLACLAGVGTALAAQYGFDMQPCPWCILQRVIFIAIAIICAAGAIVSANVVRAVAATLAFLLTLAGSAAALWQHFVAAKSSSCNLTLADKIISALGLESLLPAMFRITASCADSATTLLGVPFEFWSLTLSALLALAAILSMRSPPVR